MMMFTGFSPAFASTASLSTTTIPLAAGHCVALKSRYTVVQVGFEDFPHVTGQKRVDFDAQSGEMILPLPRYCATKQHPASMQNQPMAFLVNGQVMCFENCRFFIRMSGAYHQKHLRCLKEGGDSLPAKWNGNFHDRGSDLDIYV